MILAMCLFAYLTVAGIFWYPLFAALDLHRRDHDRAFLPNTWQDYERDIGGSLFGATLLCLIWPLALVPLLSIRFWTGHWFLTPTPTKEKVE